MSSAVSRCRSSHDSSGDIIGHTTPVKSEIWQGWKSKGIVGSPRDSGGIISLDKDIKNTDEFEGWTHRRHTRISDSGNFITSPESSRSEEFQDLTTRGRPQSARSSSGDIVGLRTEVNSDDFCTIENRRRSCQLKYKDNVGVLINGQEEYQLPNSEPKPQLRTSNFPSGLPNPEDIIRPYRSHRRMTSPPSKTSSDSPVGSERYSKRIIENGHVTHNVLDPERRSEADEASPASYLGDRKRHNYTEPESKDIDEEHRPTLKLNHQSAQPTNPLLIAHDATPRSLKPKFSKRIYHDHTSCTETESTDSSAFTKKVYPESMRSNGLDYNPSSAPGRLVATYGINQGVEMKSVLSPSRQRNMQGAGDVISWRDVKF